MGRYALINGHRVLDIRGQRFGRLTVLGFAGIRKTGPGPGSQQTNWRCRCECSSEYDYALGNLRSGASTQCRDCGNRATGKANTTHGLHGTAIWRFWQKLKRKGLLCDAWAKHMQAFYDAVGDRPSSLHRLVRFNGEPFGPGNAEWITPLDKRIKEYVRLTREDLGEVRARFASISKQRICQLLNRARGGCACCGGIVDWRGEGKPCLCGPGRPRQTRQRAVVTGTPGRPKTAIPEDFRRRIGKGESAASLAKGYGVPVGRVYQWIRRLELKKVYV